MSCSYKFIYILSVLKFMYNSIYLGTDNELEYGRKMFMVENCVIFYFYLFVLFRILTNVHARIQWFLLFFLQGVGGVRVKKQQNPVSYHQCATTLSARPTQSFCHMTQFIKIKCHARQTTCRFIYVSASVHANARRVGFIYKMLSL